MFWQKTALIALILTLTACLQTENSSSLDAAMYGGVGGTPEFQAARTVMSQSCNGCHAYHTQTEAQLIAAGLIVAADPEASQIYYRLVGSTGIEGPKDMPQGGALSSSDAEVIAAWIENLTP